MQKRVLRKRTRRSSDTQMYRLAVNPKTHHVYCEPSNNKLFDGYNTLLYCNTPQEVTRYIAVYKLGYEYGKKGRKGESLPVKKE